MATWTEIDASRLEPGKPIRSIDGLALRDNPVAIAEGAVGAPRIQEPAMSDNSVANRALVNGSVTATKLAASGGETSWVLGRNAGANVGVVGTYALLMQLTTGATSPGTILSGSSLRYASAAGDTNVAAAGSWRCMGYSANSTGASGVTLWLRYA